MIPTSEQLARAAYAAMCRPPSSREHFERVSALTGTDRAVAFHCLTGDEQADVSAYARRRIELMDVYGEQAAMMQAREDRLAWLRRDDPGAKALEKIAWVKRYYALGADQFADFINDLGYTVDPRMVESGKSPVMAFSLFPRQREMIHWLIGCWMDSKPGVVVKARDVGASWVAMALLATLCIFRRGFAAGVGSAVEIKIDRSGDPDTLFYKLRSFLEHLPVEFNGGFDLQTCSADKRVSFPLTGSSITGEAGDQAGRGGRKSIFIVDESAHFEHPKIIDKNLSRNTNCRIDISSVNGRANSFYQRAHPLVPGAIRRFDFTWRHDPRMTQEKFDKLREELDDVTFRQEILCDWDASLEGSIIPRDWAEAAVDIDKWLNIDMDTGAVRVALDIADRGNDLNALAAARGRRVWHVEQWSGKGSDTGYSVQRAMRFCADNGIMSFEYDADGMGGAAVHSDARLINEARTANQQRQHTPEDYFANAAIGTVPYRGSEAVVNPEKIVPGTRRKAKDLFANRKAQSWYMARLGCYQAWLARQGRKYDPELMVCIASDSIPKQTLELVLNQLAQATQKETLTGKIQVDKNPDDVASPDMADACVMVWAPRKGGLPPMGPMLAAMGLN